MIECICVYLANKSPTSSYRICRSKQQAALLSPPLDGTGRPPATAIHKLGMDLDEQRWHALWHILTSSPINLLNLFFEIHDNYLHNLNSARLTECIAQRCVSYMLCSVDITLIKAENAFEITLRLTFGSS